MNTNLFGASGAIIFALLCYLFFIVYLKRNLSRKTVSPLGIATSYGLDLGENRGFIECTLVHTRAGKSALFFDADQWLSEPYNLEKTTKWITRTILRLKSELETSDFSIDGLAFIEKDSGPTGLISLQHLIGMHTDMKTCIIRLHRWPFLPQAAIKGEPPAVNSNWILISDVATTGGHLRKAAKVLNHPCWNANAICAIVLLNRGGELAIEELKKQNIRLISNNEIEEEFNQRKKEFCEKEAA